MLILKSMSKYYPLMGIWRSSMLLLVGGACRATRAQTCDFSDQRSSELSFRSMRHQNIIQRDLARSFPFLPFRFRSALRTTLDRMKAKYRFQMSLISNSFFFLTFVIADAASGGVDVHATTSELLHLLRLQRDVAHEILEGRDEGEVC